MRACIRASERASGQNRGTETTTGKKERLVRPDGALSPAARPLRSRTRGNGEIPKESRCDYRGDSAKFANPFFAGGCHALAFRTLVRAYEGGAESRAYPGYVRTIYTPRRCYDPASRDILT